jgi:pimeloyl-ACP methyl ester carboxylesterase
MGLLLRCVIAACVCLLAVTPAWAQNSGGLPGKEHLLAGEAYKQAERVVLLDDEVHGEVVHYQFDVPVGSGPFDVIRIHRVVKEVSPGRPAKKMEGVLLLPGLPQLVEGIFLPEPSPGRPVELSSAALFLASHGVDVWGMDYGWSFIPYPTTDFGFLRGWGIDKDAAHIQIAMSIARWLRATSEQGNGPIHLLGFSYGGFLVYAAAGEDTKRPGNLRDIKGIIPVDGTSFKAVPGSTQQLNSCNNAKAARASLDAGVYHTDSSATMIGGFTALNYPDDLSPLSGAAVPPPPAPPVFPAFPAYTFTNFQAALVNPIRNKFLGGSYTVTPPAVSPNFTDSMRWVMIMTKTPAYAPNQWNYDNTASRCASDTFPVAFDDHLGDIDVPILYIARQETGFYTTTLTQSRDVTKVLVNPTLDPSLYGHADFFLANNAASEIWQAILDWIEAHR